MSSKHWTGLSSAFAVGLTVLFVTTPASAKSVLQQMEGTWKGNGSIIHKQDPSSKEHFACRIVAKYKSSSKSLKVKGRCGANMGSASFRSILTEDEEGNVSGLPILQRGDLAEVVMSGKTDENTLRLDGETGIKQIHINFLMQNDKQFQTQSGLNKGPRILNRVLVNWKKQ